MLVTFRTKASADITMFGHVAEALLRMMGQSGVVPGALMAPDVAPALSRLKDAIERGGAAPSPQTPTPPENDDNRDEERSPPVSLRQRAYPLIGLLEAAVRDETDVTWAPARSPLL
jgi:hypothetical protein